MYVSPEYPTVTSIVNTHGDSPLLARALESVLKQDYTDQEVIVVHDGPVDSFSHTMRICKEYATRLDEVGILLSMVALDEPSGYQCVPKNVATHMARGDYITYLDADNEWMPTKLSTLVSAMEEGTVWPDFVYGRRLYVKDAGCERDVSEGASPFVEPTQERVLEMAQTPMANFIDTGDFLVARGAMWRLQLATGKMWNEDLRRFGDWELLVRGMCYSGWRPKAVDSIVQTYHWTGANLQLTRPFHEAPRALLPKDFVQCTSMPSQ